MFFFLRSLILIASLCSLIPVLAGAFRFPEQTGSYATDYTQLVAMSLVLGSLGVLLSYRFARTARSLFKGASLYPRELILDGLVVTIGFLSLFSGVLCHSEQYFPFYPSIDTVYSKNFDEKKFQGITPGASKDEVLSLLGEPLSKFKQYPEDSLEVWEYSSDGACNGWCDFAWLGRAVTFGPDGKVKEKWERVADD
jgi:hypothetical protein